MSLSFPDLAQRDESYRQRLGQRATETRLQLMRELGDRFFVEKADAVIEFIALSPAEFDDVRPAEFPQTYLLERAARRLAEILPSFSPAELPAANFDLAGLELASGRAELLARAEARLRPLAEDELRFFRGSQGPSDPRLPLARVLARTGRPSEARQQLEAALLASPGDPFVLAELYALDGDLEHAVTLVRYYSQVDADWLIGRAALFHGRSELAYRHLSQVALRFPQARRVLLELAAACAVLGRDDEGTRYLIESLKLAPVPVADAALVVPMIERWATRHPEIPAQFQAISLLQQHGAFTEAAVLLGSLPPATLDNPFGRRAQELALRASELR